MVSKKIWLEHSWYICSYCKELMFPNYKVNVASSENHLKRKPFKYFCKLSNIEINVSLQKRKTRKTCSKIIHRSLPVLAAYGHWSVSWGHENRGRLRRSRQLWRAKTVAGMRLCGPILRSKRKCKDRRRLHCTCCILTICFCIVSERSLRASFRIAT